MYFCSVKRMIRHPRKTLKISDMAKPIEPTPVLKGDDAYEFVAEMEKSPSSHQVRS